VYAVGALNVTSIPQIVTSILSVNPNPELVVIALGTSASLPWTEAQLKSAVDVLPA
jgi:hypothetical protein